MCFKWVTTTKNYFPIVQQREAHLSAPPPMGSIPPLRTEAANITARPLLCFPALPRGFVSVEDKNNFTWKLGGRRGSVLTLTSTAVCNGAELWKNTWNMPLTGTDRQVANGGAGVQGLRVQILFLVNVAPGNKQ